MSVSYDYCIQPQYETLLVLLLLYYYYENPTRSKDTHIHRILRPIPTIVLHYFIVLSNHHKKRILHLATQHQTQNTTPTTMKTCYLLWLLAFVTIVPGAAGYGFWGDNKQEEEAVIIVEENSQTTEASISALGGNEQEEAAVNVEESSKTIEASSSSRTLKTIIKEERRFLLFDSRRLTGKCRKLIHDV